MSAHQLKIAYMKLTFETCDITIALERRGTYAILSVVSGLATGPGGARTRSTKRHALLLGKGSWQEVTLLVCATLVMRPTANLDTCNLRIALEARRTGANALVKISLTLGPGSTNFIEAGIDTISAQTTFLVPRAVGIHPTLV